MPSQFRRRLRGRVVALLILAILSSPLVVGCAPKNIGRYNDLAFCDTKRVRNVIWKSYDDWYSDVRYWIQEDVEEVADFPGPTAPDLRPPEGDYILGPGDVVQITVQDLFREGQPFVQPVRVSEEGSISMPMSFLQDVKAEGFTARGLERRLAERLMPPDGPLRDPRVAVFIMEYRNRTYSIVGGVRNPGIYPVVSHDMTLVEALSQAAGINPFHEQYMYVVREMTETELADIVLRAMAEEAEAEAEGAGDVPEVVEPADEGDAGAPAGETPGETTPKERATSDIDELETLAQGGIPKVTAPEEGPAEAEAAPSVAPEVVPPTPPAPVEGGKGEWRFQEGQWVYVEAAKGEPGETAAPETAEAEPSGPPESLDDVSPSLRARLYRLGVVQGGDGLKRIIRIDIAALIAGDQTQNVVMRNGDLVNIPEPPAGEWYINGEVVRRGVYSLTGRKITLLQAIAAAGGLTELAIPKRTELVRRISEEAEEIIYVDLEKIAKGEAPDFYLQPNDYINVGTDQGAIWMAVLRNAFRATYGFGLVYDQNFADIFPWKGGIHPLFGS